ncbi:hypothetical protein JRE48_002690 [Escherichia coli]|uniref:hypothetical protein n=1 Tax=Enterobacteriaceae TaxID=543 RepID=UPI0005C4F10A|nr:MULTISPECIES: hypothetical protein [Enterobacteriaceae]EEZ5785719.1 hypothetical protein [Escherichia coli O107]EEU9177288.1 hypothetical protein [Escherichia coli]EEU9180194.1 hypothetical protein [Escherichia coli]EEW1780682.1 hypothetical protein [Escherichia coli]EEW2465942.1 hypothetical protein [Escherichia coli]
MDKQTIQNIMQFMLRVNLTGQEVPAFTVAMNALQAELDRENDQPLQRALNAAHNKTVTEND